MSARILTDGAYLSDGTHMSGDEIRDTVLASVGLWQLMRDAGEHPERAAERLGMTPAALSRALRRHGQPWLELEAAVTRAQRVQRAER